MQAEKPVEKSNEVTKVPEGLKYFGFFTLLNDFAILVKLPQL
jgi:hypothetical protein